MSLEIRLQHAIADRRLMTYRPEEILPAVNQILFQTYVLLGFSPPNDRDLGILIAKLAADLQESYPSLTLQEVALCFDWGPKVNTGIHGIEPAHDYPLAEMLSNQRFAIPGCCGARASEIAVRPSARLRGLQGGARTGISAPGV